MIISGFIFNKFGKLVFLALALLLSAPLKAEYTTTVHSISRREGLSNGAVNTIAKDSEGYIWFGTWNGLNRYDGNTIVTYLPGSNQNSIHNHVIRELYPTSVGPVWMLTNKGVGRYDNIQDRFTSYFTKESEQINYENDISICHSDSYGTLASVFGRGIFSYNSAEREFIGIRLDKTSQQLSLAVKRIHIVNNRVYCITAGGKLMMISGNRLVELLQLPLAGVISSASSVLINQRPYLLVIQRAGPALMVDLLTKEIRQLQIPDDIITSLSVSMAGKKLWIGSEKGRIYSYDLVKQNFEVISLISNVLKNSSVSTRIQSIYETANDVLWIGTDGNGVYNMKLTEFPNKSLSSDQLAYPIVRTILVTSKGDVLIGTKGGGIDVFNAGGNHIRGISVKNGLSNNSVLSLHEQDDGSVWVGTDGKGIDIISPDYRSIRNFPRDFNIANPIHFASVYRIIENSDKHIYLGTSGFGVIMVELDKTKTSIPVSCEQLVLDKSISAVGQQKQIVYSLAEEKPGVIWIGTRGLGVYRYNTITKRVIGQYTSTTHPKLIPNDDILSLSANYLGRIWIGTSNGIFNVFPVSADSVKVEALNAQTGLSNTSIHALQFDKTGNLWITTNQGLSLIDDSRRNVRSFNTNDGLVNFEYSDGASFFDINNDRLYVGGTMGMDIIQTDEIKFSSYFPPVAINQLYVMNQPVEPGNESVLSKRINHQESLNLAYNQNSLTFYVSALAFWGQERHRISYRLNNFLDNWTTSIQNQPINFSNLEPGKYLLQIRASDENGNWSKKLKEVEILINPPFWRTKWAIAAYILLFIGIQLLIIRSYIRRESRRKEAALLELTQQKEKELQNYKIEFFTNVAHEFRTPLTLITSHIHALIEEAETTGKNPRLLKVYNNSIRLQKLVLEIIQFRKLEKGKVPLNISRLSPEKLALEVISDLELLAQKKEITCEVTCNEKDVFINTDADKYQRVITNLVTNAIKYSRPGGFVVVRISFGEHEFITEVEDNGVGIDPEFKSRVFEPFGISSAQKRGSFPGYKSTGLGLAVTKGIVDLLEGTISYESKLNEGTVFTCRFPDNQQVNTSNLVETEPDDSGEMVMIDEINSAEIYATDTLSTEKPTVLIVDDDSEILQLLKDMFRSSYNICTAQNGIEALQVLNNQSIDLVVSDIMMPEMDGIELCSKLRENFDTSHLPLILLTAKAEIEDRIKGLQAGADSYIPKPFHPNHLKIRIEKLLAKRQNIRKSFNNLDESAAIIKEIPDPFFQKLLNYIDQNIDDESLMAEKLCDRLAISKSSLYNKTKSVLGTTPHGLINQRRMRKASVLLNSTSLSVSEIIDQTGFTSRAHFYDLFNKSFGCSPSEYRQKRKSLA